MAVSDDQLHDLVRLWDLPRLECNGGYYSTVRFIPGFLVIAQPDDSGSPYVLIMPIEEARDGAQKLLDAWESGDIDKGWFDDFFPFDLDDEDSRW